MQLNELVATTLAGMGFDLVDLERRTKGVMCVYIDHLPTEPNDGETSPRITVEDCEQVTHQLLHVFTVENVVYERLEVSSPGLDRPLTKISDFKRFAGELATVKLKIAMPGSAHQKSFQGVVIAPDGETLKLEIETREGPAILDFTLADVDKARLVPRVDFRSRKA